MSEYGLYGAPRPLPALFTRTRPPGLAHDEAEPWPAMPALATVPCRLSAMFSKPACVSAPSVLGAALYPNLNSLIAPWPRMPCRLKIALVGLIVILKNRPLTS